MNRPQFNSAQLQEINGKVFDWADKTPLLLATKLFDTDLQCVCDIDGSGLLGNLSIKAVNTTASSQDIYLHIYNDRLTYDIEVTNKTDYNPETWGEWIKTTGVTGNADGLTFVHNGTGHKFAYLPVNLDVVTKYGLLLNVVEYTLSDYLKMIDYLTGSNINLASGVGMVKQVFTTQAVITRNDFELYTGMQTAGNTITIKDVRLFALPTGSQIEADFENLTADQLNEKYPYDNAVSHHTIIDVPANSSISTNVVSLMPFDALKIDAQITDSGLKTTVRPSILLK